MKMNQSTVAQAAAERYAELETYVRIYRELYGHTLNVVHLAANDEPYQALIRQQAVAS